VAVSGRYNLLQVKGSFTLVGAATRRGSYSSAVPGIGEFAVDV